MQEINMQKLRVFFSRLQDFGNPFSVDKRQKAGEKKGKDSVCRRNIVDSHPGPEKRLSLVAGQSATRTHDRSGPYR